jgi:molybdopterin-synthase adenylyltransferase
MRTIAAMNDNRYARQILFSPLGSEGQERLRRARAAVVGCGALGTNIVNHLLRGGIGFLRVIDRDIVDWTNLHRQVLFDERDASEGIPKATAVARHAASINSEVTVEAFVEDLTPRNALRLLENVDIILDGTDNAQARYLINDFAVKNSTPWIYGGAIGATAVSAAFVPGGSCLRCLWPDPPVPGALPTCDTAGVLPPAPALAASLQAAAAMRFIAGAGASDRLLQIDLWNREASSVRLVKKTDCPTCGKNIYEFLEAKATNSTTVLCGRDAVQISPPEDCDVDMEALAHRLEKVGEVKRRGPCVETAVEGCTLLIFPDGRVLVKNTGDTARARSLVSKYVGY